MTPTPRSFSHIGLSVPDLDQAVKFYADVLGFYVIMQPTEVVEDGSDIASEIAQVHARVLHAALQPAGSNISIASLWPVSSRAS